MRKIQIGYTSRRDGRGHSKTWLVRRSLPRMANRYVSPCNLWEIKESTGMRNITQGYPFEAHSLRLSVFWGVARARV